MVFFFKDNGRNGGVAGNGLKCFQRATWIQLPGVMRDKVGRRQGDDKKLSSELQNMSAMNL